MPSTPMTRAPIEDMILVYDLRRDRFQREQVLSRLQEQWEAYKRGEWPVHISEGRIRRLFFDPQAKEHMFELDQGARSLSLRSSLLFRLKVTPAFSRRVHERLGFNRAPCHSRSAYRRFLERAVTLLGAA